MKVIFTALLLFSCVSHAQEEVVKLVICPSHVKTVSAYDDGSGWPAVSISLSKEGSEYFSKKAAETKDAMVRFVDTSGTAVSSLSTRLFGPIENEFRISGLLSEEDAEKFMQYLRGSECVYGASDSPNKRL